MLVVLPFRRFVTLGATSDFLYLCFLCLCLPLVAPSLSLLVLRWKDDFGEITIFMILRTSPEKSLMQSKTSPAR